MLSSLRLILATQKISGPPGKQTKTLIAFAGVCLHPQAKHVRGRGRRTKEDGSTFQARQGYRETLSQKVTEKANLFKPHFCSLSQYTAV